MPLAGQRRCSICGITGLGSMSPARNISLPQGFPPLPLERFGKKDLRKWYLLLSFLSHCSSAVV